MLWLISEKIYIAAERNYMFLIVSVKSYIIEFELCDEITKNILNGWTGDPNKAYNNVYYTSGEHKITIGYFYLSPTSIFEVLSEGWIICSGYPEASLEVLEQSGSGPEGIWK